MCGNDSGFPDQIVAWKRQQRDFLGLRLYFWKNQYMKWDTQQGIGMGYCEGSPGTSILGCSFHANPV